MKCFTVYEVRPGCAPEEVAQRFVPQDAIAASLQLSGEKPSIRFEVRDHHGEMLLTAQDGKEVPIGS
jgi:hypothetical protein